MTAKPLQGIRVVEFTHMIMGPMCGLVMADLGADVIKVEPVPNGDNTRRLSGSGIGFFVMANRNKRSLAVDLKTAEGMKLVHRLIRSSDVLIENFRPGALDKLGLGYDTLAAGHPRLIYCSCKGFLPGPYDHRTALDEVVQMMGGLAYMTGPPGQPLRAGASAIDILGGTFGAVAILAALAERDRTGKGQRVQSALFESVALLMAQHMAQAAITGSEPPPMSVRQVAWPVYDIFQTADHEQVFIGVVTDTQWQRFCAEFGLTDLSTDSRLATQAARLEARPRILPRIAEVLGRLDRDTLMQRCEGLGLPFAPIARPAQLFEDPHLRGASGLLPITLPDGRMIDLPALPISMDGNRLGVRQDVPKVGEHNNEIAQALGYSAHEIGALRTSGVLV